MPPPLCSRGKSLSANNRPKASLAASPSPDPGKRSLASPSRKRAKERWGWWRR